MVVVTALNNGQGAGCLVGFHTQCSIDPPRYAVLLSKMNHTYEVALTSDVLAVNLLGVDGVQEAELFGGRTEDADVDKFERCDWTADRSGVPILDGAIAWIVGAVVDRVDVGDHVLHVLEPLRNGTRDPTEFPLRYHDVASIEPGHPE